LFSFVAYTKKLSQHTHLACDNATMSHYQSGCKLVVFNLPEDVRESQVKDLFRKFGYMREIRLRQNRGATNAFIEYEDPRDAEEALDRRNDYSFAGKRLRVEHSRPPPRKEAPMMRDAAYRVKVTGLPRTASWQDLKDFMRAGGDVRFTDVEGNGIGTAGFSSNAEMDRAIRELDDTKFRARNGDTAYVRVKEDGHGSRHGDDGRGRGGDDDRGRSESRGRGGGGGGGHRSRSRGRSVSNGGGSRGGGAGGARSYSRSRSRR